MWHHRDMSDGIRIPLGPFVDPKLAADIQAHFDWLGRVMPSFSCERGGIDYTRSQQGGAVRSARRAHNAEDAGSNPAPAP
jgi:hypothetical protein